MHFLTIFAVLATLAVRGPVTQPSAATVTAQEPPYTYVGTVRTVAPAQRTVSLITGVGFALKLIEIRVPQAAPITHEGSSVSLANLGPGAIIRAECRMMEGTPVAQRVEVLERAP